jgi:hypothetical protein
MIIDMTQSISARAELGDSSLPDFHRFQLEQCIVWNRDDQVRATLANLQTALKDGRFYNSIPPEAYWQPVEDEMVSPLSACDTSNKSDSLRTVPI